MKIHKTTRNGQLIHACDSNNVSVYENFHHRWLLFGDVIQSLLLKRKPGSVCMPHQQMLTLPLMYFTPKKILDCGLGGGDLARFYRKKLPETTITSVEISPEIIDIYRHYFNPEAINHTVLNNNAINVINTWQDQAIDWLVIDLYQDQQSSNFENSLFSRINKILSSSGWLSINFPAVNEQQAIAALSGLRHYFHNNIWVAKVPGCKNLIVHANKQQSSTITLKPLEEHSSAELSRNGKMWSLFKRVC